ncbi:hypothetical protein HYH02_012011 [Chlamydomonas schloesseri]|uniref:Peptidase M3A/M3B catalytic domain-containing protein n=1 Tax=Chlamydomonas schloesseri TaxID=2026947 RepID=A0A835W2M7_9CHLO|nr:hypothetical protein HYH02_012011 [Chlamydomonas schloesseri]|eukprot:KAG2435013.1 hypothetical protein HYH02_012011 [Chlamydomonas schloesseri]
MTAVADVRACAVLAQRYDAAAAAAAAATTGAPGGRSGPGGGTGVNGTAAAPAAPSSTEAAAAARLMAAIERLVTAAAAEDQVLRSPAVFAALQAAAAAAAASTGPPPAHLRRRGAMVSALAPRFVRQGYHPPSPLAYSVALSRADKAALLETARRQERSLLAALDELLGPALPPPPQLQQPLPEAMTYGGPPQQGRDEGGLQGLSADEAAWLEAQQLSRLAAVGAAVAAAEGAEPGRRAPPLASCCCGYEWPVFELGAEELREDGVMAEVAAAQWRLQGGLGGGEGAGAGAGGGGGGDGVDEGGGQLRLTLDVCAGLLRRHPDPLLRQQVYEEGLAPLAAAALGLLAALRDVRAQQAALYGMYEQWEREAAWEGLWTSLLPPRPPQPAADPGGSGGGGGGYAALAHMDSLARDGRAAVAFLTALAQDLAPRVEAQVRELAAAAPQSGPLAAGDLEYCLRQMAWRQQRQQQQGQQQGQQQQQQQQQQQGQQQQGQGQEAVNPSSTAAPAAPDADPVAPYLSDPAALLRGVSDWLRDFMGVRLLRPAGPGPGVRRGAGAEPEPEPGTELDAAPAAVAACPAADTEMGDAAPPADVAALLDDLRQALRGDAGGGGGGGGSSGCVGHREAALASLAAAAAREPGRFLAYRLEVVEEEEGRVDEGRQRGPGVEGQRGAVPQDRGSAEGAADSGSAVRRWLLIDLYGGGGTRYVLPPLPPPLGALPSAPGSSEHTRTRRPPAAVAVLVGLQGGAGAASSSTTASSTTASSTTTSSNTTSSNTTSSNTTSGPNNGTAAANGGWGFQAAGGGREGTEAVGLLARGSEFAVWELMHELGHALHFLLAAAPPPPPPPPPPQQQQQQQPLPAPALSNNNSSSSSSSSSGSPSRSGPSRTGPSSSSPWPPDPWALPYRLPLEALELPACLLERGAAEPRVAAVLLAHCRDAAGRPPPRAVSDALAHAVGVMHFSPISVQVQVLCSLLDQLLLSSSERKAPGAAQRLWPQLLAAFAPSLPAACTIQQLHALPRLAGAGGTAHAYLVAAFLAAQLWGQAVGAEAGEEQEEHEEQAEAAAAGTGAAPAGGRGGFVEEQRQKPDGRGVAVEAAAAGGNTARGGAARLRPSGGKGVALRRLLFESSGGQPAAAELLRRVMSWGAAAQQGGAVGSSVGGGAHVGGGRKGSDLADGGVVPVSEAQGREPPMLMDVPGGGCVPCVTSERVRHWVREA